MNTRPEQKDDEISHIPFSDTGAHEATMVVVHLDADIANVAVEGPGRSNNAARAAYLQILGEGVVCGIWQFELSQGVEVFRFWLGHFVLFLVRLSIAYYIPVVIVYQSVLYFW